MALVILHVVHFTTHAIDAQLIPAFAFYVGLIHGVMEESDFTNIVHPGVWTETQEIAGAARVHEERR